MSDHILPQEIVLEILIRLPVKTLFRCKCICKSWNSIITHPSFIKTHLNHSILSANKNGKTPSFVVKQILDDQKLFDFESKKETLSIYDNHGLEKQAEMEFPFVADNLNFQVVDSINGLLLFCDEIGTYCQTYILYNPSIRKALTLPRPNVTVRTYGPFYHVMGFGFDSKTNDYKVIRLVYLQNHKFGGPHLVELYSLNAGVWCTIMVAPPRPCHHLEKWQPQAFVNGAIHWVAAKGDGNFLLLFHMGDETFSKLEMPQSCAKNSYLPSSSLSVGKLGEWLSVFQHNSDNSYTYSCTVWILKEYGLPESWTIFCNINLQNAIGRPVGLTKSDELLMVKRNINSVILEGMSELVIYHPEIRKITDLGLCTAAGSLYISAYAECLVLME